MTIVTYMTPDEWIIEKKRRKKFIKITRLESHIKDYNEKIKENQMFVSKKELVTALKEVMDLDLVADEMAVLLFRSIADQKEVLIDCD